jgi:hypothetical protein
MRRMLPLALTTLLAACTSTAPHPVRPSAKEDAEPFVRGCDSAVFGEPNMKNAVTIGPLVLVGLPQAANLSTRELKPDGGRYIPVKILAVVTGPTNVTVTVPKSQRDSVSLLYDPDARANKRGFLFSAGDARVTFEHCPSGDAQYNGGVIARAPTCVNLSVESGASSTSRGIALGADSFCSG